MQRGMAVPILHSPLPDTFRFCTAEHPLEGLNIAQPRTYRWEFCPTNGLTQGRCTWSQATSLQSSVMASQKCSTPKVVSLGSTGIEEIIQSAGKKELREISADLRVRVREYGEQGDDQTILLVRRFA